MGGHKIQQQFGLHYLTLTIVGWVDIFSRKAYRDIIIDSLKYCQTQKGLELYAYTIMSNHIHLIVKAKEDSKGLSAIIGDFKKFTSKQIIHTIKNSPESRRNWLFHVFKYHAKYNSNNTIYQVWIQDNHPIQLVSPKWIQQKITYIHLNAVRAGIVEEAHHYLYASASNYYNGKGLLEVEVIDFGVTDFYVPLG